MQNVLSNYIFNRLHYKAGVSKTQEKYSLKYSNFYELAVTNLSVGSYVRMNFLFLTSMGRIFVVTVHFLRI